MTTDYSHKKTEVVEDDEPAVPVVVRSGTPPARPSGPVRIVVERHKFSSWFVRGVAMGIGFSTAVYVINWFIGAYL